MLTKSELIEVMDAYIKPFYYLIGGTIAVIVIAFAIWLVLWPFLRRI